MLVRGMANCEINLPTCMSRGPNCAAKNIHSIVVLRAN